MVLFYVLLMDEKLPSKLSPQAKKLALSESPSAPILCQAEVAPNLSKSTLEKALEAIDGSLRSFDGESRLATFELPSDRLRALAEVEGIVYIDVSRKMSRD